MKDTTIIFIMRTLVTATGVYLALLTICSLFATQSVIESVNVGIAFMATLIAMGIVERFK